MYDRDQTLNWPNPMNPNRRNRLHLVTESEIPPQPTLGEYAVKAAQLAVYGLAAYGAVQLIAKALGGENGGQA